MLRQISRANDGTGACEDLHGIDGPEDQGEPTNGGEEGGGLVILLHGGLTTVDGELVDDDQVGNASHGVPAPLGRLVDGESSEETGEDHDDVRHDGDEDAGTIHAGQEAEVEQQERGGDTPVNIAGPVDLTVDDVVGVWEVLLGVLDGDLVLADTITDSHGIVGDGGEGSDEGSQDVEQSFLLGIGLAAVDRLVGTCLLTTGTRKAMM